MSFGAYHTIPFTKMHGTGNDYIYIDASRVSVDNPSALARRMSDRHFGVGSDGLVLILPSQTCDVAMRMFNADGTESEMCGNASRCVGKYVYEHGWVSDTHLTLETLGGRKHLELTVRDGKVTDVCVDMGAPVLEPSRIPALFHGDRVISAPLRIHGVEYAVTCVSMGNPHAVVFVEDVPGVDVSWIGPEFEHHIAFPQRVNAEFATVIHPGLIQMRVWERGAGETLACGTGACATLVAGVLNGVCGRQATIRLSGGDLLVEWRESDNHVYMTGNAVTVFEGTYWTESLINGDGSGE
jgi:diaminopimelate epimerase